MTRIAPWLSVKNATEALAYYPVQVEKMLAKYEQVIAEFGGASAPRLSQHGDRLICGE